MTAADIERLAREAGAIHTDAKAQGGWVVGLECFDAAALSRFASLVEAHERERLAMHFDARDRGPDGKPLGIGFYDPHEPAEIIRALWSNASGD